MTQFHTGDVHPTPATLAAYIKAAIWENDKARIAAGLPGSAPEIDRVISDAVRKCCADYDGARNDRAA
jgi:hypothetical protein